MLFLSDVDGCVVGLMEGFSRWMWLELDEVLDVKDISLHSRVGDSPKLAHLNQILRSRFPNRFPGNDVNTPVGMAFIEFMGIKDCYERYCEPIPNAIDALTVIGSVYEPVFVTATMKKIPETYASKYRFLQEHFPGIPMISCPSELKHVVGLGAAYAVDDRYDICDRWEDGTGIQAMCFKQPWNEAPDGAKLYDWPMIVKKTCISSSGRYSGEF